MEPYSAAFKAHTLKLADKIGPTKAARKRGVSYNTLRRWRDPDFAAKEQAGNKKRKSLPCLQCGKPATKYGREHPEHEGLCRSCINTLVADDARGTTVSELVTMYSDGLSTNQIAVLTHRSQSSVYAILASQDVEFRPASESIPMGKEHATTIDPKKVMAMRTKGKSINAIATRLGCSPGSVQYWLRKLGDPKNVRSER